MKSSIEGARQITPREYKAALLRMHRRMSGMLAHPLSDKVLHQLMRESIEAARDALTRSLGFGPEMVRVIGEIAADDEICVRLADDGEYVFALQDDDNWKWRYEVEERGDGEI